jgi:hypothetical protein
MSAAPTPSETSYADESRLSPEAQASNDRRSIARDTVSNADSVTVWNGTSSFRQVANVGPQQGATRRIVNTRFHIADTGVSEPDVLIKETINRLSYSGASFSTSEITVEGYPGPLFQEKRWTVRDSGDTGSVWNEDYYRTLKHGCCGGEPTRSVFSLSDGKRIVTGDRNLLHLKGADTDRFIGYRSMRGMLSSPIESTDDRVFGVVEYANEDGPINHIILRSTRIDSMELWWSPTIKMVARAESDTVFAQSRHREGISTGTLSGQDRVAVRLQYHDSLAVDIPVRDGRLTREGATHPPEISLEVRPGGAQ